MNKKPLLTRQWALFVLRSFFGRAEAIGAASRFDMCYKALMEQTPSIAIVCCFLLVQAPTLEW